MFALFTHFLPSTEEKWLPLHKSSNPYLWRNVSKQQPSRRRNVPNNTSNPGDPYLRRNISNNVHKSWEVHLECSFSHQKRPDWKVLSWYFSLFFRQSSLCLCLSLSASFSLSLTRRHLSSDNAFMSLPVTELAVEIKSTTWHSLDKSLHCTIDLHTIAYNWFAYNCIQLVCNANFAYNWWGLS